MSINRIELTECPSCHEQIPVLTWQSLNTDLDPEAKEKLLSGALFWVTCPKCQKRSYMMYPMLYHDKEHKVMIQLAREQQEVDEFMELISAFRTLPDGPSPADLEKYQYRVVRDTRELREKAMLFHLDLDDRIIEMVKYVYSALYQEQNPEQRITRAFFESEPSYKIQMFAEDGPMVESDLPMEAYEELGKQYRAAIENRSKNYTFIDRSWAESILTLFS